VSQQPSEACLPTACPPVTAVLFAFVSAHFTEREEVQDES
jgi:hypothetical protein